MSVAGPSSAPLTCSWLQVGGCAEYIRGVRDRLDTQDACDAEVTELRFASCVEQDVARFDITMHQARSVNHCQSRCDSRSEGGYVGRLDRIVVQPSGSPAILAS